MDARVGSWMCERTLLNWRTKLGWVLRNCRHGGNKRRSPILSYCSLQWVSVSPTSHELVSWHCLKVIPTEKWRQGKCPSSSWSREGGPASEVSHQRTQLCFAGYSAFLLFSEDGSLSANHGTGIFRWTVSLIIIGKRSENGHMDQLGIRQQ